MEQLDTIIDLLVNFWRLGKTPGDLKKALLLQSLAETILDQAGLKRADIRVRPHRFRSEISGILTELNREPAYQMIFNSLIGQPLITAVAEKRARILKSWRVKGRVIDEKAVHMPAASWMDLEIGFEQRDGGTWETRARSPHHRGDGSFVLPFEPAALITLAASLKDTEIHDLPSALIYKGDLGLTLHHLGRQLFDTLMQGSTRDCFNELLGLLKQDVIQGIRLFLSFGRHTRERLFLRQLPWEWLHDGDEFLALNLQIAVIRGEKPSNTERVCPHSPLRVLHAGFSSHRWQSRAAVNQIHRGLGHEPESLMDPRYKELVETLGDRRFDIFHFGGHGRLNPVSGQGELQIRCRADAKWGWVAARELCPQLLRAGVSCVVLNACDSAVNSEELTYESTAAELLRGGIPVVIAMRGRLRMEALTSFRYHFYRELSQHQPWETALASARRAVKVDLETEYDWHLPVLMMGR